MTESMRLSRRGFLGATAVAAAGLASGTDAFARGTRYAKKSPLVVYDWSYYQKDYTGFNAYFKKYGVPKYITFNTDQAELAKAASGAVQYDVVHPCIAYIPDWKDAGLVKEINTSKLKTFKSIDKSLLRAGHRGREGLRPPVGLGLLDPHVPGRQVQAEGAFLGVAAVRQAAPQQGHDVRRRRCDHQDRRADQRGREPEPHDAGARSTRPPRR